MTEISTIYAVRQEPAPSYAHAVRAVDADGFKLTATHFAVFLLLADARAYCDRENADMRHRQAIDERIKMKVT